MSTSDSGGPFADVEDVRRHLHLDEWDTTGITDEQIRYFIAERANLIVEEDLLETDQSKRRLRTIETLLAGHYILDSGIDQLRQGERERASDGSETWYAGEFGEGLRSTSLGEQAIGLDNSGKLAAMADGEKDTEFWHVTRP